MSTASCRRRWPAVLACALFAPPVSISAIAAQTPTLPSETPTSFSPATSSFDYVRRNVMIPMRDGVKLHTVILVPKSARRAPILLTRTPYDASATTTYAQSAHLALTLNGHDSALQVIIPGGYIRTGTNNWEHLTSWPSGCSSGCTIRPTPLYLESNFKVGLTAPTSGGAGRLQEGRAANISPAGQREFCGVAGGNVERRMIVACCIAGNRGNDETIRLDTDRGLTE